MKAETLIHRHPPTPPIVGNELQSGLSEVAQYVAERNYSVDDQHRNGSAYGSPGPVVHDAIPHQVPSYHSSPGDGHLGPNFGLGISYDGYSHGPVRYQENQHHYDALPNNQALYSGSPPTPRSAIDHEEADRHTRSGRPILPPSTPPATARTRPKAAPRPRKAKAGKSEKPKTPKLTAALSILTKDMTAVPVRNMEEWVNRTADTRWKEVEKRQGYITRPMNSFMLYRSAFAERTKQWCLQNNHQVVSSVSGESWPLEPPEVRELYNEYAKIERINHQNAHPNYKFSPSKASAPPRNSKRKSEEMEKDPSDMDDSEWSPVGGRHRIRPSRRADGDMAYPGHQMNPDFFDRSFGPNGNGSHRPSWDMAHAGRPMPMPMPMQDDLYNHYFQTGAVQHHPNMGMGHPGMEEMHLNRVGSTSSMMHFGPSQGMLGLPGGNAADMMQHLHSQVGTPLGDEGQVDPMLLAFDGNQHQGMEQGMELHPDYRNGSQSMDDRELDQDSVRDLHEDFHPEPWQHDPNMAPMEQGSEFEKWMDDHHG